MKTRLILGFGVAALFFILLWGCEKDALSTTNDDATIEQRAGNSPQEKVTGSGSMTFPSNWRTFSFTAQRDANGMVTGQWTRVNHTENTNETHSHGVITCMTVVGNEAWFGGYATSGLYSEPPNNGAVWRIVDNGQGNNNPPDLLSGQYVQLSPEIVAQFCIDLDPVPVYEIEAGNIKIH